jgi:hypothetical protein
MFAPKRTLDKAKAKRDALAAEVTRRGVRVEIAEIRRNLERQGDNCKGAEQEAYMSAVDAWISSLEAKFGTSIPFDEACKLADELEAED